MQAWAVEPLLMSPRTRRVTRLIHSERTSMRIVLRWALILILGLITAFCCFGFLASGEFKPPGAPVSFSLKLLAADREDLSAEFAGSPLILC